MTMAQVVGQLGMLQADVFAVRYMEPQVLGNIVRPIPVDVVDTLGAGQWAPQHLLHNKPMFHHEPSAIPDPNVPTRGNPWSAPSLVPLGEAGQSSQAAPVGTEAVGTCPPVGSSPEADAAPLASECGSLSRLAVDESVRTLAAIATHSLSVAHSHSFVPHLISKE